MLPLDQVAEFDPRRDEQFLAALPARPAVYRLETRSPAGRPYLRATADLRRSCRRFLTPPEGAAGADAAAPSAGRPRLNLRELAARLRYRLTGSAFEQSLALHQQARELFPENYRERMRLAPPTLLKLNLAHDYPRCYLARRIAPDGAFYFGPFPSRRSAEEFAREFLALYKIRRCHIKIRRDPGFPGCIYSEMKMCLAPCFAGCTKPEYDAEVARVAGFLASRGLSLASQIEADRDQAAATEDFERAAALHKRHEKLASVLRHLPELPRKLDALDAVILQRAATEGAVAVYRVRAGAIGDPFLLNFRELSAMPRSLETILREALEPEPEAGLPLDLVADYLALLARWFYAKPRAGEILFREPPPAPAAGGTPPWPLRRIIRACARVLGPQPLLPGSPAAPP